MFNVEVNKVDPGFEDRLYLVNSQLIPMAPQGARFVWNNPAGGALEWTINSQIGIIDTAGDVRWYLLNDLINDQSDPWTSGLMMGFQQTKDGALTWGFGQRWVKYDLMGPRNFSTASFRPRMLTSRMLMTMPRMATASCASRWLTIAAATTSVSIPFAT